METTVKEWFGNHPPDLIQFPKVTEHDCGMEQWIGVPTAVFKWSDPTIQIWLNLIFDDGFGSQDVPPFHAWTHDKVYYVWEYDGSTSLAYVPRNPKED